MVLAIALDFWEDGYITHPLRSFFSSSFLPHHSTHHSFLPSRSRTAPSIAHPFLLERGACHPWPPHALPDLRMISQPIVESLLSPRPYHRPCSRLIPISSKHRCWSLSTAWAIQRFQSSPRPSLTACLHLVGFTHRTTPSLEQRLTVALPTLPSPLFLSSLGGLSPLRRAFPWFDFSRPRSAEKRIYRCACRALCSLLLFLTHARLESIDLSHRCEPPPKFPLASPYSSIVHHLSGPNSRALTQILPKTSASVDSAPKGFLLPFTFITRLGARRVLALPWTPTCPNINIAVFSMTAFLSKTETTIAAPACRVSYP